MTDPAQDVERVRAMPHAAAAEVLARTSAKVEAEDRTREELLAGRSLRDVFDCLGVL